MIKKFLKDAINYITFWFTGIVGSLAMILLSILVIIFLVCWCIIGVIANIILLPTGLSFVMPEEFDIIPDWIKDIYGIVAKIFKYKIFK